MKRLPIELNRGQLGEHDIPSADPVRIFLFDADDERLFGPDGPIRIGNKAVGVLATLLSEPGRLVTKDMLLDAVWDGVIVTESALTSVVKELRRALGDDHRAPTFIESVYGRGYRFIAPVSEAELPHTHRAKTLAPDPVGGAQERDVERRHVTILACVLKGRDTPADLEDLLLASETLGAAVIDIAATTGALLIHRSEREAAMLFGLPVADEEDAARAGQAALQLRDQLDIMSGGHGVGIGLATGPVLLKRRHGEVVAALGETVDAAWSLAREADPGRVLAAETTRRSCEGMFVCGAPSTLDTVAATLAFVPLESVVDVASKAQARPLAAEALVGRKAELERLQAQWAVARENMGQAVLIAGEPGMGKTRLASAFLESLADQAFTRLEWHCGNRISALAFHPVAEDLRRLTGLDEMPPSDRQAFIQRWAIEHAPGCPDVADAIALAVGLEPAGAGQVTPERRRETMFVGYLQLLEALGRSEPVLLLVEDQHWADPTSLELLSRIVGRAPDHDWMIVITSRSSSLPELWNDVDLSLLALDRLDETESRRLCELVDTERLLPAAMLNRIVARGGGNPLFTAEVARFAVEQTRRAPETDGMLPLPDSLHELLAAGFDRLGDAREIARIGAAFGRSFSYEMIAALSGLEASVLRDRLRQLVRSGFLETSGIPPLNRYAFRHALFADAAYDTLLRSQREALHARIAATLEEHFADMVAAEPALLADHLTRSGQIERAIPYWAAAGVGAAASAAHLEAVEFLQTALDLVRRTPCQSDAKRLELDLLIGLAVSLAAVRGFASPDTAAVLDEARRICDELETVDSLFIVLRGLCAFDIVAGKLDSALGLAERCLEISRASGRYEHRLESHCSVGYTLWAQGKLAQARPHLEEAIALYLRRDFDAALLTPQHPLVPTLGALGLLCVASGDPSGTARVAQLLEEHVLTLQDGYSVATGLHWRATLARYSGDLAAACAFGDEASALIEKHGYLSMAPTVATNRAAFLGMTGRPEEGLALALPALAAFERIGQRHALPYVLAEIARLHAWLDDMDAALAMIDKAVATAEAIGELYWIPEHYRCRAAILSRMIPATNAAEVRAALATALDLALAQGARGFAARIEGADALELAPFILARPPG